MLTNADMTVYHLTEDDENAPAGQEKWVKTVIRGVCWQSREGIQAESGSGVSGVRSAALTKVYIPESSWNGCISVGSSTSKERKAPCLPEDRIARGIRQELVPPEDACAVTEVSHKDMGMSVRHWAIVAV